MICKISCIPILDTSHQNGAEKVSGHNDQGNESGLKGAKQTGNVISGKQIPQGVSQADTGDQRHDIANDDFVIFYAKYIANWRA